MQFFLILQVHANLMNSHVDLEMNVWMQKADAMDCLIAQIKAMKKDAVCSLEATG